VTEYICNLPVSGSTFCYFSLLAAGSSSFSLGCRPTYQDSQPAVSTAKLPWIQDRNISYSLLKKGLLYKKDKSTTTAICHQR